MDTTVFALKKSSIRCIKLGAYDENMPSGVGFGRWPTDSFSSTMWHGDVWGMWVEKRGILGFKDFHVNALWTVSSKGNSLVPIHRVPFGLAVVYWRFVCTPPRIGREVFGHDY